MVTHDFIIHKEDFSEAPHNKDFKPYFKAIEFLPAGECISVYGDEIINGTEQGWTKGYWLRKFNDTTCAYEIKTVRITS